VSIQSWLNIQRISLFLYLASGVLALIYALGFISNIYLFYAYGGRSLFDFYNEMQLVNRNLLWKAIIAIIFTLVLFLLELGKHPAGFFTLIITIIITVISVLISVETLLMLINAKAEYSRLEFDSLSRYIQRGTIEYEYSTVTYNLGIGAYALYLVSSLFMAFIVIRNALKLHVTQDETREGE